MADQSNTAEARCPFADPLFQMDPNKPCPVCGDFGNFHPDFDEPSRCVGGENE